MLRAWYGLYGLRSLLEKKTNRNLRCISWEESIKLIRIRIFCTYLQREKYQAKAKYVYTHKKEMLKYQSGYFWEKFYRGQTKPYLKTRLWISKRWLQWHGCLKLLRIIWHFTTIWRRNVLTLPTGKLMDVSGAANNVTSNSSKTKCIE